MLVEDECLIIMWLSNLLFSTVLSAGIYLTLTALLLLSFSPLSHLSCTHTRTHTHVAWLIYVILGGGSHLPTIIHQSSLWNLCYLLLECHQEPSGWFNGIFSSPDFKIGLPKLLFQPWSKRTKQHTRAYIYRHTYCIEIHILPVKSFCPWYCRLRTFTQDPNLILIQRIWQRKRNSWKWGTEQQLRRGWGGWCLWWVFSVGCGCVFLNINVPKEEDKQASIWRNGREDRKRRPLNHPANALF